MIEYHTYILHSLSTGRYYIGHTSSLSRRLDEHNKGFCKSTKCGAPWRLVYSEIFRTRGEAVLLEGVIKKRGAGRYLSQKDLHD